MTRSTTTRQGLPRDWVRRSEMTRRLAGGQCEQRTDDGARCAAVGVVCGHVDPLAGHDPLNLLWLCRNHFTVQTAGEVVRPSDGLLGVPAEVLG